MSYFNVRVYGLMINAQKEVLLSDEHFQKRRFTKFPGGGLELGEGIIDALKREFREECEVEIQIVSHLYTTDFYEKSSFNDSQIISVYYVVKSEEFINLDGLNAIENVKQKFRWLSVDLLSETDVTFKTDQIALKKLKEIIC